MSAKNEKRKKETKRLGEEANRDRIFGHVPPRSRLRTSVLYDNIIIDCDFRPFVINGAHRYLFPPCVAYAYGCCLALVFDRRDFEVKIKVNERTLVLISSYD